jgi:hypothetical protein
MKEMPSEWLNPRLTKKIEGGTEWIEERSDEIENDSENDSLYLTAIGDSDRKDLRVLDMAVTSESGMFPHRSYRLTSDQEGLKKLARQLFGKRSFCVFADVTSRVEARRGKPSLPRSTALRQPSDPIRPSGQHATYRPSQCVSDTEMASKSLPNEPEMTDKRFPNQAN